MFEKILVVRKMSALEYYYNSNHKSNDLNLSDKEQGDSLREIESMLKESGAKYNVVTRKELDCNLVDKSDLLISAGGDGTVIASAAYNKNTPQLNLCTDKRSKGNLCNKNIKNSLRKILRGDYYIENWTRQDVYLDGNFIGRVLNETCVGENMDFSRMARYIMNGEFQKNSGLVAVTGTGSTGWPSAFQRYPRSSKIFRYRTILPVEGNEKGEEDKFSIEYKGHEGKFAIDTIRYELPRDSLLELKLSQFPLKVVMPK